MESPLSESLVREHLLALSELSSRVAALHFADIARIAQVAQNALERGGRLFFCGNGGSAADAQHLACEYVVRFSRDRAPLPAIALTTDTSILTACANDFGFEEIFARQVRALGREGDVLFIHSTSGESENLICAAQAAREVGVVTIALLAKGGGRLASRVDHALVLPTQETARAQEIQLAIGHIVCDIIDREFSGESA